MSTMDREELFNIGRRLRAERDRLGLSQEAFGTKVGTTGRTIKKYERNETSPRATELLVAWGFGLDVLFVITGEHAPLSLREERASYSPAERLAEQIRAMTLSERDASLIGELALRLVSNTGKDFGITGDSTGYEKPSGGMITEHDFSSTDISSVKSGT